VIHSEVVWNLVDEVVVPFLPSADPGLADLLKSGPTFVLVMKSWWIHMNSHYPDEGCETPFIYNIEVGSSLKWFAALTRICGAFPTQHQPRTCWLLLTKLWTNVCDGNGVMTIYIHHHCKRRCSSTFQMYKLEVGSRLKLFVASTMTMKLWCLSYPLLTQDLLITKIWANVFGWW